MLQVVYMIRYFHHSVTNGRPVPATAGTFIESEARDRAMACVLLYVTAGDAEEAVEIGRVLVEERLVACANVIPGVRSIYRWQGAVRDEGEAVLFAKTEETRAEAATARIKALHSYDLPCVVVWPLTGGNADFLEWIENETGLGKGSTD
jgi:periplasmic divalent cation tolerance protein